MYTPRRYKGNSIFLRHKNVQNCLLGIYMNDLFPQTHTYSRNFDLIHVGIWKKTCTFMHHLRKCSSIYLWGFACFFQDLRVPCIHICSVILVIVALKNLEALPFETTLQSWLLILSPSYARRISPIDKRAWIQNPAEASVEHHGHN